jgi:hypothetical protein
MVTQDSSKHWAGDSPCDIVTISNNQLICYTPTEETLSGTGVGPRGLLYEISNRRRENQKEKGGETLIEATI